MYIILGATGHVGAAVAVALLDAGEPVTAVMRDADKAAEWRDKGAQVAVVDVADVAALRDVFRQGRRAFLLNPPADPATDTDREEHRTLAAIVAALDGSGLEKVVLESTYGARAGERIGDLSVLYDFEQALAAQPIPATFQRAAYYMTNWDEMLEPARQGALPSMLPADMVLPMVAPADLGAAGARLLRAPTDVTGTYYVEGPERYSIADVAAAFAEALGREVAVEVTPRDRIEAAFRDQGFSEAAADAFARMMELTRDEGPELPDDPIRGEVTLRRYIAALVEDGGD